jgi:5-methylcytosine-specific restriction endonuclease McrA
VEAVSKRESLNHYLQILSQYDEQVCFYCGHSLSSIKRKTHIDHFIPWSYVQNDTLWNLVIACQKCNTRKSDKLTEEKYLNLEMKD